MNYEFDGLPLHVLLVHFTVIVVPLAALCTVLVAAWPAARRRLGIVSPLIALAALIAVPITVAAGQWLQARRPTTPLIAHHTALGTTLLPWSIAVFAVAAAQWLWYRWGTGAPHGLRLGATLTLAAAVAITALGSVITVVIIGEAGAAAVWTGILH